MANFEYREGPQGQHSEDTKVQAKATPKAVVLGGELAEWKPLPAYGYAVYTTYSAGYKTVGWVEQINPGDHFRAFFADGHILAEQNFDDVTDAQKFIEAQYSASLK